MKKHIKYLLAASFFTAQSLFAQSLFAQSTTETEGMDMSAYASRMGTAFLVALFVMIAVFLLKANKEPAETEEAVPQGSLIFVRNRANTSSGSLLQLLPGISIDLQRVRYLLASALIMFSTILLLLIIQK
jgi:hypothetical protein